MEKVRLGIVGCGVIGRVHLGVAKQLPEVEVVAVADLREEAAQAAMRDFGIKTAYNNADDLFSDDNVEGVILAMPTASRTELALRAFAEGKHVLIEKPVAMNSEEVEKMISARGNLIAGCCSSRHRFLESSRVATEFISRNELGKLRSLHCRVLQPAGERPKTSPPPWRLSKAMNGGGILVNWGCYDLDYMLGITGWSLKPSVVLAQTWSTPPKFESHIAKGSDAEAYFSALIRCENGIVISFERGEYMPIQGEAAWQVIGENGSLRLQMVPASGKKIFYDKADSEKGVLSQVIWEGNEDWNGVHVGPMKDFAAAILEGKNPETTLEKALIVQRITDAIYASAEQGRAIEIRT